MFNWIQRIRNGSALPPRDVLLNQGLKLAMQWGKDWLMPVHCRLAQRFPALSQEQLDELNTTCQAAMSFGHRVVYDLAEKFGKETMREDFARSMSTVYPWVNEANMSQLFNQGMYYAWKDMGFD